MSPQPNPAALAQLQSLKDEIRSIAMVAGQCSIEGDPDGVAIKMAAAEAERCERWANQIATALDQHATKLLEPDKHQRVLGVIRSIIADLKYTPESKAEMLAALDQHAATLEQMTAERDAARQGLFSHLTGEHALAEPTYAQLRDQHAATVRALEEKLHELVVRWQTEERQAIQDAKLAGQGISYHTAHARRRAYGDCAIQLESLANEDKS